MKMEEYIKELETEKGNPVSRAVLHFAEQLDLVGHQFENRGREDAANGLPEPTEDMFLNWSKKIFADDLQLMEDVADIMQIQYMKGYNAGEAAGGEK